MDGMDIDITVENKDIAEVLSTIANYYTMARDTYRTRSYATASNLIANHPTAILSGTQAEREIKGIGKSIHNDIDEFIATGTTTRLQELQEKFKDQKTTIDLFRSIYGIGPVTAFRFYNAGYRTLEDIWLKGNLNDAQKIGIAWREHFNLKIDRAEMDLINQKIHQLLDPYGIHWDIAGSYRREEPQSGDIDLLVESRPDLNMEGILFLLKDILPPNTTLAVGKSKMMGVLRLDEQHNGHRIDIRMIQPASYPFALLYFTGSQRFNILMRQRAIDLGYTLNEYGLFSANQGPVLNIKSEEDIFNILRVPYLTPKQRLRNLTHI